MYSLDECSILLTTRVKKVLTKKGEKPILRIEKIYKGVNIIAAISAKKEVVYQILEDRTTKYQVMEFLDYLHHTNNYKPIQITLDNANMHRNKEVYDFLKDRKTIELHFQPTHSPQVNGVEELWRQLRQWLRGRLFFTLQKLRDAIYDFFIHNTIINIDIVSYLS